LRAQEDALPSTRWCQTKMEDCADKDQVAVLVYGNWSTSDRWLARIWWLTVRQVEHTTSLCSVACATGSLGVLVGRPRELDRPTLIDKSDEEATAGALVYSSQHSYQYSAFAVLCSSYASVRLEHRRSKPANTGGRGSGPSGAAALSRERTSLAQNRLES
jgi:hypothetical protein